MATSNYCSMLLFFCLTLISNEREFKTEQHGVCGFCFALMVLEINIKIKKIALFMNIIFN